MNNKELTELLIKQDQLNNEVVETMNMMTALLDKLTNEVTELKEKIYGDQ